MHWGAVCASSTLASRWADDLLPSVPGPMTDQRRGVYVFSKAIAPCLSALSTARRFDELEQPLALDPKPLRSDQQREATVYAARGDVDGAIRVIEAMRGAYVGLPVAAGFRTHGVAGVADARPRWGDTDHVGHGLSAHQSVCRHSVLRVGTLDRQIMRGGAGRPWRGHPT